MNIPLPPADKLAHFFYGSVISAVSGDAAMLLWRQNAWTYEFAWNLVFGALMALLFGVIKDYVVDALANKKAAAQGKPAEHTVDPMDVVWTAAGGVATMVPAMVAVHIVATVLRVPV